MRIIETVIVIFNKILRRSSHGVLDEVGQVDAFLNLLADGLREYFIVKVPKFDIVPFVIVLGGFVLFIIRDGALEHVPTVTHHCALLRPRDEILLENELFGLFETVNLLAFAFGGLRERLCRNINVF